MRLPIRTRSYELPIGRFHTDFPAFVSRGPPQRATGPLLQKPPVMRQRAKGIRFRAEARIGGALPGCRAARGSGAADQLLVVIETKLGFFSSINAKQSAVSTRGDSLLYQLVERDRQVTHAFSRGAGGLCALEDESHRENYASILGRAQRDEVTVEAKAPMPVELQHWSMHSHSALFCEVRGNTVTGEVCVSRFLGSFDCGRILNAKTAASQFRGGIILGLGLALMGEVSFDERSGRIMNPSVAEYHVPVHLDVPDIDVIWTDAFRRQDEWLGHVVVRSHGDHASVDQGVEPTVGLSA